MQNPLSERAKKKKRLMKGCLNAEQRKCNRWVDKSENTVIK
jgi:hypothetical protein